MIFPKTFAEKNYRLLTDIIPKIMNTYLRLFIYLFIISFFLGLPNNNYIYVVVLISVGILMAIWWCVVDTIEKIIKIWDK